LSPGSLADLPPSELDAIVGLERSYRLAGSPCILSRESFIFFG